MVNDELVTALALLFVQSVRSCSMLRTRNRFARIVVALPTMFPQRRNGQVLPVPATRWCRRRTTDGRALCFPGVKFADSSTLEPIEVGGCGTGQLLSTATLHSNCSFWSDKSENRSIFTDGVKRPSTRHVLLSTVSDSPCLVKAAW